jgi:S1-C subfamily serine protease
VIERDGQRQRVTFPATPAILPPPPHLERTERAAPLAQSPAPGFAEAGLTRVERPGQPAGYAVGGGSPLAAAGFAPGDVLIDVDGRGLSPETVAGLRERVMSGAPLEIRFERNGQIMTKRFGNGAP